MAKTQYQNGDKASEEIPRKGKELRNSRKLTKLVAI